MLFWEKTIYKYIKRKRYFKKWYSEPAKKVVVFGLFQSIAPNLDDEDVSFIKKHAFNDRSDDERFMGILFSRCYTGK